jgi:hypothetical protein
MWIVAIALGVILVHCFASFLHLLRRWISRQCGCYRPSSDGEGSTRQLQENELQMEMVTIQRNGPTNK